MEQKRGEKMSEQSTNDLGAFLAGFVIGGLVGAAAAIILAPQSGQETRAQIAAKSGDLIHAGEEQYQQYRDAAGEYTAQYINKAGEMVSQTREQARIVLDRSQSRSTTENGGSGEQESADSNEAEV